MVVRGPLLSPPLQRPSNHGSGSSAAFGGRGFDMGPRQPRRFNMSMMHGRQQQGTARQQLRMIRQVGGVRWYTKVTLLALSIAPFCWDYVREVLDGERALVVSCCCSFPWPLVWRVMSSAPAETWVGEWADGMRICACEVSIQLCVFEHHTQPPSFLRVDYSSHSHRHHPAPLPRSSDRSDKPANRTHRTALGGERPHASFQERPCEPDNGHLPALRRGL